MSWILKSVAAATATRSVAAAAVTTAYLLNIYRHKSNHLILRNLEINACLLFCTKISLFRILRQFH